MPYAINEELPAPVRKVLPRHAQDIYRAAFNDAFARYGAEREAWHIASHGRGEAALRPARGGLLGAARRDGMMRLARRAEAMTWEAFP